MHTGPPAVIPQRLVCTRGTTRFWLGATLIGIGVAACVLIAGMALYLDGFGDVSRGTMLAGAGVAAALLGVPGAFLMIFTPRVVIDLERGEVHDVDGSISQVVDHLALLRTQVERTVTTGSASLATHTNHLTMLRRSDLPPVRAVADALAAGDAARAEQALLEVEWSPDAVLVLGEHSDGRAEYIAQTLRAAGVATVERLIGDEGARVLLAKG